MNLRAALKYQMHDSIKAAGLFFLAMWGMTIIVMSIAQFVEFTGRSRSSLEGSSVFFVILLGIMTFEEDFHILIQNACSRKTMMCSFIIQFLCISFMVVCFDMFNSIVLSQFIDYESLFIELYGDIGYHWNILWGFSLYFMLSVVSYFFITLFKLLSKSMRIIVFVGVPLILVVLLPSIDFMIFNGEIMAFLLDKLMFIFGLQNGVNALIPVLSFSCISIVFISLAYITTKRSVCV